MVKDLPCLGISKPDYFMIVETDASNSRYGGILKQRKDPNSSEQLVCYTSESGILLKEITARSKRKSFLLFFV